MLLLGSSLKNILLRFIYAASPVLPSVFQLILYPWPIPAFSPRQIIDSNDIFPFLLAPWSAPTSSSALICRAVQVVLTWRLPKVNLVLHYTLWIVIALVRTLVGFILSHSVGWAYPPLFCHWAVYEETGGFGAVLLASIYLYGPWEVFGCFPILTKSRNARTISLIALSTLLCWLDNTPWTYSVTLICVAFIVCFQCILRVSSISLPQPNNSDTQSRTIPTDTSLILKCIVASFLIMLLPYYVVRLTAVPSTVHLPMAPFPPAPLLEIIILTHPRLNVQASTFVLNTTIASYIPLVSQPDVVLSVFTHVPNHAAFKDVQGYFAQPDSHVTFYTDQDEHPDATSGQYLHIAEAFRWASAKGTRQAEWVMLVEDDFPLCMGERGKNAFRSVMQILEASRKNGNRIPARRGGFIGTGGSGLIIHQSLLPILTLLMRIHAEKMSKLPSQAIRRPPDVLLQDCLLGIDPLCPKHEDGKGLIITSRLVMDHIGGMVSTNQGKPPNSDKWRCGWRHPFHGRSQVQVVII